MAKKQIRLSTEVVKKGQSYSSPNLDSLIKEVQSTEPEEGNLVRMNFEVSEELRNAFKAKVAHQGKKVKDVLAAFMKEYIKGSSSEVSIK